MTTSRDRVCGKSFREPVMNWAVAVLVFKKTRSGSVGFLTGETGEAIEK